MLTTQQLRQVAARSGARDIANVEIDVILTQLLQLFHEKGLTEHLAFKGGTMLRKMVFGPRGRLSTDLDFTRRTDMTLDDLMLLLLDALEQPYHGIDFRFDRDRDWYLTDDGCAANPVCSHADNPRGVKIKLQISIREKPVMPVVAQPQLQQDYFRLLPFEPADIPSLALEEVIAEKVRAANQRSKIRDLHDLSELAARPFNRDLVRSLAVLKLWNSGGAGLNFDTFRRSIEGGADYDVGDLRNLLRNDQTPELPTMIRRVVDGFQFLGMLSETERALAADRALRLRAEAQALQQTLMRRE
ncbi:MAG: nucleotidyl transferase AbiEii/AbiGii toxin family protein [Steroidobacteraceae bacterium]|nr:nucleotidyl transferase AbiEii/AbiGii toxin family protein [Steroidobacteraceae bacterium]MCW5572903.1 nucleotidyl transferase AbiEii/AbiGii toxin family protein [Steroidobacteraceae bacterium]